MTRVLHTGDTHLGYQQYHSPERRQDFLDAFERVVVDAIEDDVDAVVHAGDLFHDRRPELVDILGTLSVLRRLDDAGIPFLAVVGNHEVKRDAQWLDLFASLGLATRLDDEPVVLRDTAFYGLDYVPKSRREELEYEFEPHDAAFAALVTHGLFQPFDYGDWDAETVLAESTVEFDAMLLGDNHKPGVKQAEDGTWLTYCGSTERASADEREDRGYNLVEFDGTAGDEGDGEVTISRRGLPTREFRFVDVELRSGEGAERVRERVAEYDHEDAVTVVTVTGEGEPFSPARIEEQVREAGALVVRVNDRREFETAEGADVSFADPDEAVRERVREMGLSSAARELDEVVRASKVADSTVSETVERRVAELLQDGDDSAFERAPDTATETGDGPDASTAAERLAERDGSAERSEESRSESERETAAASEADAEPGEETKSESETETEAEAVTAPESSAEGPAEDGQTDWGDFA